MKIWKGTPTLDGFIDDLRLDAPKEEAEVILVGGKVFNLAAFPSVRGIFKCGIGTDNLPFGPAAARGVEIRLPSTATQEVIFSETASFAAHLCLRMLYSNVGHIEGWTKEPRNALSEKRVLLLGNGNIGRRVAGKLAGFCRVATYDPLENDAAALNSMIREADCVSLHLPLQESTRGFIDSEKLARMKDGAALVNTARGPVVDEMALLAEMRNGRLRAAFDVFWKEPYEGPLKAFHPDPFFMTPHVASTCREFLEGLAQDFRRFLDELSHDI